MQLFFVNFSWSPGSGSCDPGSWETIFEKLYTPLQKKVYTFRLVEHSEGSGPEINLEGVHYSLWSWSNQLWISGDHFLWVLIRWQSVYFRLEWGVQGYKQKMTRIFITGKILNIVNIIHISYYHAKWYFCFWYYSLGKNFLTSVNISHYLPLYLLTPNSQILIG